MLKPLCTRIKLPGSLDKDKTVLTLGLPLRLGKTLLVLISVFFLLKTNCFVPSSEFCLGFLMVSEQRQKCRSKVEGA